MGSSSSSSSSSSRKGRKHRKKSEKYKTPPQKGGTMCFGSRGSITSGGAGEPFSPGRAPQPPPSNVYKRGGVWVGCLVLGGWVPQNPKTPQPLINVPW